MKRENDVMTLFQNKKNKSEVQTKPPSFILIDGFYSNHFLMTADNLDILAKAALKIVLEKWNISSDDITWVCVMGSWCKCKKLFFVFFEILVNRFWHKFALF